jgi:photosynthetic reaction center cytochrome c subunit
MTRFGIPILAVCAILTVAFAFTLERGPIVSIQRGFRGLGIVQEYNLRTVNNSSHKALNAVPDPEDKIDPAGTLSSAAYQNVQVLKDLDSNEFLRLMNAITKWVAPEQGCAYCHGEGGNFAEDALYTKVVARRMLQMTQNINANWKQHVANTGVTCYTCHRGNPVPQNIWFTNPNETHGVVGNRAGQNAPARSVGLASLPNDPFTPFLDGKEQIRVQASTPLPAGDRSSIKQTEWTYGLMMHMSTSLGVNCTYCHNSRSWQSWSQSSPQRVTAWYGIRLVRQLNNEYLTPLTGTFPPSRLGPHGDVAKTNCATCHQGAYKPLYGASMVKDYPELSPGYQGAADLSQPQAPALRAGG